MKEIQPPKLAQRFLLGFLRDDLVEDVSGDLDEKFYKTAKQSLFKARINYWYQVFNYVRPFAMRKKSRYMKINQLDMFQNYFKIAFRNLKKNTGYSIINIGGLAVGIMVAMLIGLWINDEVSFDKYHDNYDRIAQVYQNQTFNGKIGTGQALPRPIEHEMREKHGADFTYISMSSWTNDHILTFGENKISRSGTYVQKDFPKMFSLKMIHGVQDGLNDPSSIMLDESTAKALFGDADPINQNIQIDSKLDVKVTGVYEDFPNNTSLGDSKFYASWELYITSEPWLKRALTQWGNNSFQMYVQLTTEADLQVVGDKIKNIKALNIPKEDLQFKPEIILHRMSDWHLHGEYKEGKIAGGRIEMVWMFGIIGSFVLLLACINFMNLSTARSEKRAKEVGIRMTIGSVRSQLINQFLSESFLVVLISFVIAMLAVILMLPWFNELADKKIVIDWLNSYFILISIVSILITSLLAGSYPALYLSSFNPVKVLKGTFKMGRFAALPRKVLVVIQFTVSVTLIIGTIIVYNQIQYTKNRPIGYNREGLISIQMKSPEFYGKFDVLRSELKNTGAVEEMSESSSPITSVWQNSGGFKWAGMDPALQTDFATIRITHEYGKTIGWTIKEGRDFSRDFATDSTGLILNQAAVKFMGITDPVGKEIIWDETKLHVIGVIDDVVMQSPYNPVKQTVYYINYDGVSWINLKLNPEKSASESITAIEGVFKKIIPSAPFDFKFIDEEYAKKFDSEERVGKLSSVFAVLAVFISCLGLFGLASFVAEQRTKEIGIRKVLGASVLNLWRMLSKDFIVLVILSCVLAIPIAYHFLNIWLMKYQYHTQISWWTFAGTSAAALFITIATVSFQAVKAAVMNSVKSLKSE